MVVENALCCKIRPVIRTLDRPGELLRHFETGRDDRQIARIVRNSIFEQVSKERVRAKRDRDWNVGEGEGACVVKVLDGL